MKTPDEKQRIGSEILNAALIALEGSAVGVVVTIAWEETATVHMVLAKGIDEREFSDAVLGTVSRWAQSDKGEGFEMIDPGDVQ